MKIIKKRTIIAMMITLGAAMLFTPVATQAKSKSKEIAITKKNFPGKILHEYVCKHYDKNKNGELSYAEIKKARRTLRFFNSNHLLLRLIIHKNQYGN